MVAKLDADLDLNPTHFERMLEEIEADPALGIAGACLADVGPDGTVVRHPAPAWHVRGASKFYRGSATRRFSRSPPSSAGT